MLVVKLTGLASFRRVAATSARPAPWTPMPPAKARLARLAPLTPPPTAPWARPAAVSQTCFEHTSCAVHALGCKDCMNTMSTQLCCMQCPSALLVPDPPGTVAGLAREC
jgi:hypothetical protein